MSDRAFDKRHPEIYDTQCPLCGEMFTKRGLSVHIVRNHTTTDAEKLARAIEVYDQAKASMSKILQSDASDMRKVEQLKGIVLQADKKVGKILQSEKKDSSNKPMS